MDMEMGAKFDDILTLEMRNQLVIFVSMPKYVGVKRRLLLPITRRTSRLPGKH
jgi:hypothetical protein